MRYVYIYIKKMTSPGDTIIGTTGATMFKFLSQTEIEHYLKPPVRYMILRYEAMKDESENDKDNRKIISNMNTERHQQQREKRRRERQKQQERREEQIYLQEKRTMELKKKRLAEGDTTSVHISDKLLFFEEPKIVPKMCMDDEYRKKYRYQLEQTRMRRHAHGRILMREGETHMALIHEKQLMEKGIREAEAKNRLKKIEEKSQREQQRTQQLKDAAKAKLKLKAVIKQLDEKHQTRHLQYTKEKLERVTKEKQREAQEQASIAEEAFKQKIVEWKKRAKEVEEQVDRRRAVAESITKVRRAAKKHRGKMYAVTRRAVAQQAEKVEKQRQWFREHERKIQAVEQAEMEQEEVWTRHLLAHQAALEKSELEVMSDHRRLQNTDRLHEQNRVLGREQRKALFQDICGVEAGQVPTPRDFHDRRKTRLLTGMEKASSRAILDASAKALRLPKMVSRQSSVNDYGGAPLHRSIYTKALRGLGKEEKDEEEKKKPSIPDEHLYFPSLEDSDSDQEGLASDESLWTPLKTGKPTTSEAPGTTRPMVLPSLSRPSIPSSVPSPGQDSIASSSTGFSPTSGLGVPSPGQLLGSPASLPWLTSPANVLATPTLSPDASLQRVTFFGGATTPGLTGLTSSKPDPYSTGLSPTGSTPMSTWQGHGSDGTPLSHSSTAPTPIALTRTASTTTTGWNQPVQSMMTAQPRK